MSNKALICVKYNSVIVGEGDLVRDCRGIGRMKVICKVGEVVSLEKIGSVCGGK
jgi:hypothetical protein